MNRCKSSALLLASVFIMQSCTDQSTDRLANSSSAIQQWLSVLDQDNSLFSVPEAPVFPNDFSTHSQSRVESFMIQAMVTVADGVDGRNSELTAGIIAQMDRISLTPESQNSSADSGWRYSGIMRSTVFADSDVVDPGRAVTHNMEQNNVEQTSVSQFAELSDLERRQSVQRIALNLAGSFADKIWIGQDILTILASESSTSACERTYRWEGTLSASTRIAFDIPMSDCPRVRTFGEFNRWDQQSDALTGVLSTSVEGGESVSTNVKGTVWMSQSWGNLPGSGGAVVIDSLQLRLDDSRWLDISRSKRRSGRGPKSVSADLYREDSTVNAIDVLWEDSTDQTQAASGAYYPASIRLRSSEHDFVLNVRVMNRLAEFSDFAGSRIHVPVSVTGSHTGKGFLSFDALQP